MPHRRHSDLAQDDPEVWQDGAAMTLLDPRLELPADHPSAPHVAGDRLAARS